MATLGSIAGGVGHRDGAGPLLDRLAPLLADAEGTVLVVWWDSELAGSWIHQPTSGVKQRFVEAVDAGYAIVLVVACRTPLPMLLSAFASTTPERLADDLAKAATALRRRLSR